MYFICLCHCSQKSFFSFIFQSFILFHLKLFSNFFIFILKLWIPSQTSQCILDLVPHLILEILHHILYPPRVHPSRRHLLLCSSELPQLNDLIVGFSCLTLDDLLNTLTTCLHLAICSPKRIPQGLQLDLPPTGS